MTLFIILAFIVIALLFIALKLFRPKPDRFVVVPNKDNIEPKSKPGFVKIDLRDAKTIEVSLAHDSFSDFKNHHVVTHVEVVEEPKNNRYCYYYCDLGIENYRTPEKGIQLNLELNGKTFNFLNVYDLKLKEVNQTIQAIDFEVRWSDANVSLDQAFNDYKRFMQELLNLGCQNYFGLAEVRFKKEQYKKLLESGDHHCLAPDLIQFEEFKAVIQSKDFSSLDSYFYIGDFTIYIFYNADYSASIDIEYAGSIESYLSFFGNNDLYLGELSLDEKQVRFNHYLDECQSARSVEEEEAKADGFGVDERYKDPFTTFNI